MNFIEVDELFTWIAECDASLDEVIEKLRPFDIDADDQRVVVQRWLDVDFDGLSSEGTVEVLRTWLEQARCVR